MNKEKDDLVIASNSFSETLEKLNSLFKLLAKYNLTLSASKCQFHTSKINYLGFQISDNKIFPLQANIVKITSFPRPKTKKQIKRFLGVTNFYRSLIPNYSALVDPLIQLTSTKTPFKWTETHTQAFNLIQKTFFMRPFLLQPNWNEKFYLCTDASLQGLGSSLLQRSSNGDLLPVAYFSRTLSKAEKSYPAIKLELLAIVSSIRAFKQYLYHRDFIILSDCNPLKNYRKITSPADIVTRWLLELGEYSFTFQHIKGKDNNLSDYLSRTSFENNNETLNDNPNLMHEHPLPIVTENLEEDILPENVIFNQFSSNNNENSPNPQFVQPNINMLQETTIVKDSPLEISPETFLKQQMDDTHLSEIRQHLIKYPRSRFHKNYFIHPQTNLLMHSSEYPKNQLSQPDIYKIVVPNTLKTKVLTIAHHPHYGIAKTYEILSKSYHFKNMYINTQKFVLSCKTCATQKHHRIQRAPLQNTLLPKLPGQFISMDVVGPFRNGQSILTVIDHFSKHLELYPLRTVTANTIVKALFHYICSYGRPALILTDLGPQFTAEVFRLFNSSIGIKLSYTTTGRPEANSVSERINCAIKSTIRALQQEGHSFDYALHVHKMLYNASKHSTTEFPPNLVHFGRQLSTILDTFNPDAQPIQLNNSFEIMNVLEVLQTIYKQVLFNLQYKQKLQNTHFNVNKKIRNFKPNDTVYIKSRDKLKPKYDGPFKIIKKTSEVTVLIQYEENPHAKPFLIHIDRLHLVPPRPSHLIS